MRAQVLCLAAAASGCFSPRVEEGAACSPEGECPPGQTCAGDGRCYGGSPSFRYRRRIDIHPLSLGNVVRDFPMAVVLEGDSGLAEHASEDGLDIHFTDADGMTQLAFEVESFDAGAGDLVAWVRVPVLSFEDTVFLHYGGEAVDRPDAADVWSERYLAVWHGGTDADPAAAADSTGNHNDGASGEGQAPGRVAGIAGPALSFDGIDDEVLIDESVPLVRLDLEIDLIVTLWVRVTQNLADADAALGKGTQSGATPGFGFQLGSSAWVVRLRGAGVGDTTEAASFGDAPALTGRWVMLGAAITGADGGDTYFEVASSVDGNATGEGYWICQTEPCDLDLAGALYLSHPDARFKGLVDEIRIANREAGSENLRAQFENLAEPETFYSVGAEETLPD